MSCVVSERVLCVLFFFFLVLILLSRAVSSSPSANEHGDGGHSVRT